MATLIIGPNDLSRAGKNLKNKDNLKEKHIDIFQYTNKELFDIISVEDIDVIMYREGNKDVVIKPDVSDIK
jgi:hypothetical protein